MDDSRVVLLLQKLCLQGQPVVHGSVDGGNGVNSRTSWLSFAVPSRRDPSTEEVSCLIAEDPVGLSLSLLELG